METTRPLARATAESVVSWLAFPGLVFLALVQMVVLALIFASIIRGLGSTVAGSIGAAATPGAGILVLATVLSGVGIPTEGVAIILGVDRILDMTRTAVNVTGDLTAAVILDRRMARDAASVSIGEGPISAAPSGAG